MSLDDAWAKLGRAELHIEALRADIREAGQGEPYTIPLREELDEQSGNLYIRIDRIPARPQEWGLLIGDAVHNLRSALDNGWWTLACHHLGAEPPEHQATGIQFPVIRPGGTWDAGSHVRWVGENAANLAGELQPDPGRYGDAAAHHPLAILRRLSNVDKHRNINPIVLTPGSGNMTITRQGFDFTGVRDAESLGFQVHHLVTPQVNDKVITISRDSILRNPEVQFEAKQTGFIAIEGGRDALNLLTEARDWVYQALSAFGESLAGYALEVRVRRTDGPNE